MARRASIVGTGLIGASVALALRAHGWHVSGVDRDEAHAADALAAGVVDAIGLDPDSELVVVAVPVSSVADAVRDALAACPRATVTDVGSVKAPIVAAVADDRFVGGHPMAGSEQDGLKGADANLFNGATWVLTPTDGTDPERYADLRATVSSIGADVVELRPERHDALVALVSHVPHLTAATLMGIAASRAEEHATLLRLAAGGFRDMTRIAAGHPAIWPDICAENRDAILDGLDALTAALAQVRATVAGGDRAGLLERLEVARAARINLPARIATADALVEVRIPVPDRPGVLAEVTTLAGELDVNIVDLEIAHSAEGDRGVLIVTIDARAADRVCDELRARGYHPAATPVLL
ncbi:MAG TPA: prephenate dehydrogenase/arogenate dehydrogenase family protein [Acidimicrobiales bacterium]|nr:prephenate dehydrogenase/arogenate dehydrogenase family protein [Acidimicrobiales bacterium]